MLVGSPVSLQIFPTRCTKSQDRLTKASADRSDLIAEVLPGGFGASDKELGLKCGDLT